MIARCQIIRDVARRTSTSRSSSIQIPSFRMNHHGPGVTARILSRYYHHDGDDGGAFSSNNKTALVVGSSGAVGSTVSRYLSQHMNMTVIGADVLELPNESDWELDGFVALPSPLSDTPPSLADTTEQLTAGLGYVLGDDGDTKLDACIIASGGFELDPLIPASLEPNSEQVLHSKEYGEGIEKMMRMNLYPVVAAQYAVNRHMNDEAIFIVFGATAALQPTPSMIGYGLSKSATHFAVQSIGAATGRAAEGLKTKRKEGKRVRKHRPYLDTLTSVGILPTMVDTPANRAADPNADFDQWSKPIDIAEQIGEWIEKPHLRPHSGSLVKVFPSPEGGAAFHLVR